MIRRLLLTIGILLPLFILLSSDVDASILSISKDGEITWKVLADEDSAEIDIPTYSSIEVKRIVDNEINSESSVEFIKSDGKINLTVTDGNEQRQIDVTGTNQYLVEIEQRPQVQRVSIGIKDEKFSLLQRGFFASTEFPIKVDPKTAKLSVETESGDKFLSVLPYEAAQNVLRSKLISKVNDNQLEIVEEDSELQYSFSGEKIFNFFDFYQYVIPVDIKVSVSTGETESIDGPDWYKVIGFFLS